MINRHQQQVIKSVSSLVEGESRHQKYEGITKMAVKSPKKKI